MCTSCVPYLPFLRFQNSNSRVGSVFGGQVNLGEREDRDEIEEQLEWFDGAVTRLRLVEVLSWYFGDFVQEPISVED